MCGAALSPLCVVTASPSSELSQITDTVKMPNWKHQCISVLYKITKGGRLHFLAFFFLGFLRNVGSLRTTQVVQDLISLLLTNQLSWQYSWLPVCALPFRGKYSGFCEVSPHSEFMRAVISVNDKVMSNFCRLL